VRLAGTPFLYGHFHAIALHVHLSGVDSRIKFSEPVLKRPKTETDCHGNEGLAKNRVSTDASLVYILVYVTVCCTTCSVQY